MSEYSSIIVNITRPTMNPDLKGTTLGLQSSEHAAVHVMLSLPAAMIKTGIRGLALHKLGLPAYQLCIDMKALIAMLHAMSRLRALFTAVLLVLWMPATSHCALEAVGLLEQSAACAATADCVGDSCKVVESGFLKQTNQMAKVVAPDFSVCLLSLCLQIVAPTTLVTVADFSLGVPVEPQDWVVSWTFEHRTALPANAPSLV